MKKVALMALVAGGLVGCDNSSKAIEDRVVERWQAVIDSDYEKAYEYFTPAYQKNESLDAFKLRTEQAKLNVSWKNAKFDSKACEEAVCQVKVKVTYMYQFPQKSMGSVEAETTINENWINKGGNWYFLPKNEGML